MTFERSRRRAQRRPPRINDASSGGRTECVIAFNPPNPRAACLRALLRWEDERVFADDVLEQVATTTMSRSDRALLMELLYGVIRNLRLLDFILGILRTKPVDARSRQVLRIGLYQLLFMRIPAHAAVNETVALAGHEARSLVNALLRRAVREEPEIQRRIAAATPAERWSHPDFLFERWVRCWGAESAEALCRWNNQPPPVFARVNGLRATRDELLRNSSEAEPSEVDAMMVRLRGRPPERWIRDGLCYIQDPSTLVACKSLDPQPGEQVLDACAAPGGKTAYLAELMGNKGSITACDVSQMRLQRLTENISRLGVTNTQVVRWNWLEGSGRFTRGSFDRILIDTPCSNTGVLRRRVDVRWRLAPGDFERLAQKQLMLVDRLVPLLRRGGFLVYSTCSLEREENQEIAQKITGVFSTLRFIEERQTLPFRDAVDGAYAAKFQQG